MHIGKWEITTKDLIWFVFCLVLMLCLFIGLFVYDKYYASAILSGASTAISIVLSVVAILYTMIDGADSSRINQDTINRLASIDSKLKDISDKTLALKELDKDIKQVANKTIETIETSSAKGIVIDDDIKAKIENLKKYIIEDMDE